MDDNSNQYPRLHNLDRDRAPAISPQDTITNGRNTSSIFIYVGLAMTVSIAFFVYSIIAHYAGNYKNGTQPEDFDYATVDQQWWGGLAVCTATFITVWLLFRKHVGKLALILTAALLAVVALYGMEGRRLSQELAKKAAVQYEIEKEQKAASNTNFQKIHAQELETLKAKTRAAFDADGQYYSVTAPAGFTLTSNVHDSIRHELKTYFMRQASSISVTQRHLTAQASKPSLSNESKIYTTPSGLVFLRTGNTGYTDGYNSQEYSLILQTSELIDMEITQVIPGGETFSTEDMEKVADSLVLKDAKNILLKQQLCIKGDVYYKRACTSLDPF